MSTSARRAALSRVMVTPPDHQDSREHQLEGLRPGGGAEWRVVENGGFCEFSKTYRLCQTFATSPHGAPRLTWQVSGTLSNWESFNPRNSPRAPSKNRHSAAERRHAPPRAAEPLGIPGPHQGATTQRKPDVLCIVTTRTTTKRERVFLRQSSSLAGACANELHTPADVCWCADVC